MARCVISSVPSLPIHGGYFSIVLTWKEKLRGVLHVDFLVDDIVTSRVHH